MRYRYHWRTWAEFCAQRRFDSQQPTVEAVEALILAAAAGELRSPAGGQGMLSPGTLGVLLAAVRDGYRRRGVEMPHDSAGLGGRIRAIRRGYQRLYVDRARFQPAPENCAATVTVPMTRDHAAALFSTPPAANAGDIARRAVTLLALDAGLTPADLARVACVDIVDHPALGTTTVSAEGRLATLACRHRDAEVANAVGCTRCATLELLDLHPANAAEAPLVQVGQDVQPTAGSIRKVLSAVASAWGALTYEGDRLVFRAGVSDRDRSSTREAIGWASHGDGLRFLQCRAHVLLCFSLGLGAGEVSREMRREHLTIGDEPQPSIRVRIRGVTTPVGLPHAAGATCAHCAVLVWVNVFDAARGVEARHRLFGPVSRRLQRGEESHWGGGRFIKDAQRLAGLDLGLTGSSPRRGFALLHRDGGLTLTETQAALRLAKPETAQRHHGGDGSPAHQAVVGLARQLGGVS